MRLVRGSLLLCLIVLTGAPSARAEPPPPTYVREEVAHARQDFETGGAQRLLNQWRICVRQAQTTGDPEAAGRCLAYGAAARWMSGRDDGPRPVQEACARSRLLDIMGVRPALRESYLGLYRYWAAQRLTPLIQPADAPLNPPRPPVWYRLPDAASPYPYQAASLSPRPTMPPPQAEVTEVRLRHDGDTLLVPVVVNDAETLNFEVDSGASDVTISSQVLARLMRSGAVVPADLKGRATFSLADGSRIASQTLRFRSLRVGNREVPDVIGSITNDGGALLLGQSFLARFRSWSIDNQRQVLVLR